MFDGILKNVAMNGFTAFACFSDFSLATKMEEAVLRRSMIVYQVCREVTEETSLSLVLLHSLSLVTCEHLVYLYIKEFHTIFGCVQLG